MTCAPPTRRPIPNCSTPWRSTLVESKYDVKRSDPHHHRVARLPAVVEAERDQRTRRAELLAGAVQADRRRGAAATWSARRPASPENFAGVPPGTRAIQLWDSKVPHYFLKLFGRPVRVSACECERNHEPSVAQVLHLLNAPEIQAKLSHDARHGGAAGEAQGRRRSAGRGTVPDASTAACRPTRRRKRRWRICAERSDNAGGGGRRSGLER